VDRGDLWINPGNHCGPRLTRTCFSRRDAFAYRVLWNTGSAYSGMIPANFITLAHLSASVDRNDANS
jgi:hypothetical protein